MRTVYDNVHAVSAFANATIATNGARQGVALDTNLFNNAFRDVMFAVNTLGITDGSYAVTVQESDTAGGTYTPIARVLGTLPTITSAGANSVFQFGALPTKRFVQLVITSSAVTTGGTMSAMALFGNARNGPVARS